MSKSNALSNAPAKKKYQQNNEKNKEDRAYNRNQTRILYEDIIARLGLPKNTKHLNVLCLIYKLTDQNSREALRGDDRARIDKEVRAQ